MPNLPDIPGKNLVTDTTKRARVIAGAAGAGAVAVGGLVAKRVLGGHGDKDDAGVDADPIAQTPTAPPDAVAKPSPPTKSAVAKPKPKPPKAKAKPKAKSAKAKPKAKAKPPKGSAEPGNISGDKEPHHALNSPVRDPDETEYPDPFEKRADPRDPVDPDGEPFGEEPHPATGSESTSEPPLSQDPTVSDGGRPPKREKLDD